jgi:phenylacetate-coenzyme A ligase PaaK-like adenylate-forming protein
MPPDSIRITPLDAWIAGKIGSPGGHVSLKDLQSYQLEKINRVILFARTASKFYTERLAGLPDHVDSLREFSRFPFTTEEDLRNDPTRLICVSQNEIARVVTFNTSGTTGESKRCFFTPDDLELTVDFFGVGMSTMVQEGDRVLILLPDKIPDSVGDLLFRGLQRIGVIPYKHGPVHDLDETLRCMCENRINCLVGVPTQVLALVRFQQARNNQYPVRLKSILLSTDYVPEAISSIIESAWNCAVFNHYGMTEMGLGGGVFCEGNHGYHLREADMYFEIIDPQTGQTLPEGETGEVVFTTLTRKGMPLIRYRTGDRSRFLPGLCPCGSELRSLEKISGRILQEILIKSQPMRISDLDETLFSIPGLINYRLFISGNPDAVDFHFTLYFADTPDIDIEKELFYRLNKIGVGIESDRISYKVITGFPEELSSMAKRKISRNCQ